MINDCKKLRTIFVELPSVSADPFVSSALDEASKFRNQLLHTRGSTDTGRLFVLLFLLQRTTMLAVKTKRTSMKMIAGMAKTNEVTARLVDQQNDHASDPFSKSIFIGATHVYAFHFFCRLLWASVSIFPNSWCTKSVKHSQRTQTASAILGRACEGSYMRHT